MKKYKLHSFILVGAIAIYSTSSWALLKYCQSSMFALYTDGNTSSLIEQYVYPYWVTDKWVGGFIAKSRYSNRIKRGLEIDATPLAMSNFRFYFFYDGYITVVREPGSFTDCFICPYDFLLGEQLGRTVIKRVVQATLAKAGHDDVIVDGYGDRLIIYGPKSKEEMVDKLIVEYKDKIGEN